MKSRRIRGAFPAYLAVCLSAAGMGNGCRTLEKTFQVVNMDIHAQTSMIRFYSKKTNPFTPFLRSISNSNNDPGRVAEPEQPFAKARHSKFKPITTPSLALSLPPSPPPYLIKAHPIFKYLLNYSFGFSAPRIYRGTLRNYPDIGPKYATQDPFVLHAQEHGKIPGIVSRVLEYSYDETRLYFTLFPAYLKKDRWLLAFVVTRGIIRYNLEIHESMVNTGFAYQTNANFPWEGVDIRVSNVKSHYRPLKENGFILGYQFGANLPVHNLFHDAYIFLEYSGTEDNSPALKTELRRSFGGANPNPLLLESRTFKIGIRKPIYLTEGRRNSGKKR